MTAAPAADVASTDHGRTQIRQLVGNRRTNTATGARDQGDFAAQQSAHV
jgi:hypothetical protein